MIYIFLLFWKSFVPEVLNHVAIDILRLVPSFQMTEKEADAFNMIILLLHAGMKLLGLVAWLEEIGLKAFNIIMRCCCVL